MNLFSQLPFFQEQNRWSLWLSSLMALSIYLFNLYPVSVTTSLAVMCFLLFAFKKEQWLCHLFKILILGILLGIVSVSINFLWHPTEALDKKKFVSKLEGTVQEVTPTPYGHRLKISLSHSTSQRIKINLQNVKLTHRIKKNTIPSAGDTVCVDAVLTPFSGPLIPGGFDFKENNRAQGIGASGFTVSPFKLLPKNETTYSAFWQKIRQHITQMIIDTPHVDDQTNAIAASLITGQKALISNETRDNYAASGLAHILAISGLHMNLMALIAFLCIKFLFCRFPSILEQIHLPKIAALLTLFLLFFYWNISGQSMSSTRAFFMASFILFGIIIDREGLSLNFINLAAIFILMLYPNAFKLPSFQMSFFVVLGLISFYQAWPNLFTTNEGNWLRQLYTSTRSLILTSLIASCIILPFSIMHFHTLSLQGILANVIVIPLLGTIILPSLVLGLLIKWITSCSLVLKFTFYLIDWVSWLAQEIGGWPGAKIYIAHPPSWAFLLCIIGLLWLCIWQYRWRLFGLIFLSIGFLGVLSTSPPQCYSFRNHKYYMCQNRKHVFTNNPRLKDFETIYLCHALGFSEKKIQKTKLSQLELMKSL